MAKKYIWFNEQVLQPEEVAECFVLPSNPSLERKRNFRITKRSQELKGPNRLVIDGLASIEDCKNLMFISTNFASINDGYLDNVTNNKSPHTRSEKFEGVTLSRITFLIYIGLLQTKYLELMLDLTQEVKRKITKEFNITDTLYFSYTHLVCRSALPDSSPNRTDLSHMIHADNCNLLGKGICEKKHPSYYWRDYSAILYLNEDFDGGEFIFSEDLKGYNIQSSVKPKCGRVVAFSSGAENLHGVKAIQRGKRCAIGLWFTFDPKYKEFDRDLAYHMLENNITFQEYSLKSLESVKKSD